MKEGDVVVVVEGERRGRGYVVLFVGSDGVEGDRRGPRLLTVVVLFV